MASGVLLAAALVHQLPDSIEKLKSTSLSKVFPVAEFIAGVTFCLFLILEEYIHLRFDNHPIIAESNGKINDSLQHQCHSHGDDDNGKHKHHNENDPLLQPNAICGRNERSLSVCSYDSDSIRAGAPLESFRSKSIDHHHHHDLEHVAEHIHGSLLASVILLFALSIHSIFDGLAIGISSSAHELISISAAVLAHKGFAGYALGSSMVASEMNEGHYFVLVLVFSSCSPVGIFLGIIFEQWSGSDDQTEWKVIGVGMIYAIVAGTFLYIAIVEIGMKEILVCRDSNLLGNKFDRNQMHWSKLAAFFLGYVAMSSLALFI